MPLVGEPRPVMAAAPAGMTFLSLRAEGRAAELESSTGSAGEALASLLARQQRLDEQRLAAGSVDGLTIGTGREDFTQDNVIYRLEHAGKVFQLIDVPGIEGNESRYTEMVRRAIAKAHLVFYVNGTNKKPEAETAEKIRLALNRDAFVHALCNVRGKADSYESPDRRLDIDSTHADAKSAREQTLAVLRAALGEDTVKDCRSVQGLLAFCAVALQADGRSSIDRACSPLIKSQKSYREVFGSAAAMRRFSGIDGVEQLIKARVRTFETDIIESNKRKLRRLVAGALSGLEAARRNNDLEAGRLKRDFDACKQAVSQALADISGIVLRQGQNALNALFDGFTEAVETILAEDFSRPSNAEARIKATWTPLQDEFMRRIAQDQETALGKLPEAVNVALKRLREDVARRDFAFSFVEPTAHVASLQSAIDSMAFNFGDARELLTSMRNYAATGFVIGSESFPGLGSVVGAIAGAVVGAIVEILKYVLSGRDAKLRRAQQTATEAIASARATQLAALNHQLQALLENIDRDLRARVHAALDAEIDQMLTISTLLQDRIKRVSELKTEAEALGHGTV